MDRSEIDASSQGKVVHRHVAIFSRSSFTNPWIEAKTWLLWVLSALVRHQCLGKRRLSDIETLRREVVGAWQEERNRLGASVGWRFTAEDARIKLQSLYPSTEE